MRKPPSLAHLERLRETGFQLPEIEALDGPGNLARETSLNDRKLRSVKPWSVSPDLPRKFEDYTNAPLWKSDWANMFSKAEQAIFFREWMGDSRPCASLEEAREALGESKSVLKLPISAAGRGVKFCPTKENALQIAEKWLAGHTTILVEPAHHRVLDFSVQYEVTPRKITKIGMIRQIIDSSGRYRGSLSLPKFCKGLPEQLARFLMTEALPPFDESSPMPMALHRWMNQYGYSGPVGIDSYIYHDAKGHLAVRLICEINPRYTMGRVAHEIRKAVSPGCSIKLQIEKSDTMKSRLPPVLSESNRKMCGGVMCLNEIYPDTLFAATIAVHKDPANLLVPAHSSL